MVKISLSVSGVTMKSDFQHLLHPNFFSFTKENNKLTGTIPSEIGMLVSMTRLVLSECECDADVVDPSLSRLVCLFQELS